MLEHRIHNGQQLSQDPHDRENSAFHRTKHNYNGYLWTIELGGQNGEIIVWKIDSIVRTLVPTLQLMASLDQSIGRLNDMLVYQPRHEQYSSCLISIHQDNRLRFWDLKDGRCFYVSNQNVTNTDLLDDS